ncbi:hypothetical protein N7444_006258 [Penicillium canescens]|nr:hypothetical protein N7444_006258 [Penicillium canescens]
MSMQSLPVEIVYTVLRFVGSDSLRKQEACCLLVSRWWYNLAETILLEDLVLNTNQLLHIPEKTLDKLRILAQWLTVDMKDTLDSHGHEDHFNPEEPLAPHTNYLETWSPTKLLDTLQCSKISELVIDTCGSEVKGGVHICPHLALNISSLRSIRLRMRSICPQVFDLQHDSKIESILINLSLMEPDRLHAGFSRHCTETNPAYQLCEDMVAAATKVAKSQPSMKILRILCHRHPYLEIVSRDCINGTEMILSIDDGWDWSDNGHPDSDDEEISGQDLFSTESEDNERFI